MSSPDNTANGAQDNTSPAQIKGWLAVILCGAFGLRSYHLDWGLPEYIFNDSKLHFVEAAQYAAGAGDWILDRFVHPPFYPYVLSVMTWIWSTVFDHPIAMAGLESHADRATIALIGRFTTVFISTMVVGTTYLLGKRLLGTRVGLWAAAFVALSPLQILESHRINVDAPMLLWAVLSAHQAVVALQEKRKGKLLLSFALAALAGTTKYTGLYAGTLPIWVALRWPGAPWTERLRTIVAGGLISLATIAVAMSPVLLNWNTFKRHVYDLFYIGIFYGAPGQNLTGDSWVFAPYLYMTFVGLPFMLGWAVFIAGAAGLLTLAATDRRALALIAAGALPFYILQGNAETAVARYYLPLLPFMAITAAAFTVRLRDAFPKVGTAVAALVLIYTTVLSCSQVSRVGGAPQAAIAETFTRLALAKRTTGISLRAIDQPKLVIAYPFWAPSLYDSMFPYFRTRLDRRLVYLPTALRSPGHALPEGEALQDDRRWIESTGVDVVLVTSRWENLRLRKSFFPREEQFYQNLTQGRIGLREVAHEETTYFTQSWYEWADPTLDTLWTAGIGGYKLYIRDDLLPGL